MVKTPKRLASFSSGKMANPSLTALRPHAGKLHDAGCRLKIQQISLVFVFFPRMSCLDVRIIALPGVPKRVNPNMLGGNLLEIRLNIGQIILSDLLI